MDILDMYAAGMITPLDMLTLQKPYLILYTIRIAVEGGYQLLVELWDE